MTSRKETPYLHKRLHGDVVLLAQLFPMFELLDIVERIAQQAL
jgi:hypothetical protein